MSGGDGLYRIAAWLLIAAVCLVFYSGLVQIVRWLNLI